MSEAPRTVRLPMPIKILIALVPVAVVAAYVAVYAVNMLYHDEFSMVDLLTAEQVDFAALMHQHGEHWNFFPRIVYYLIAKATAMNSVAQIVFSLALTIAVYACLGLYLKRVLGDDFRMRYLLIVGLALFSLAQFQNWLWGFQISYFMTAAGAVFAAAALERALIQTRPGAKLGFFLLAVASAAVASYSTIHGLLVWPALLVAWGLYKGVDAFRHKRFWIFLVVAIGCWTSYFLGYVRPEQQAELGYFIHHLQEFGRYVTRFLGTALSPDTTGAVIAGAILLAGTLYVSYDYRRSQDDAGFLPIALMWFGVLAAIASGVRLTNFGSEADGRSSRYAAFSILVVAGLCMYLFTAARAGREFREGGWRRRLSLVFLGVVVFSFAAHAYRAVGFGERWREERRLNAFLVHSYETQPDYVVILTGGYRSKRHMDTEKLRAHGYNLFSWYPADDPSIVEDPALRREWTKTPTLFNWGTLQYQPDDGAEGKADPFILFRSWAVDRDAGAPLDSVYVYFNDRRYRAYYGLDRADVAHWLMNPAYRRSGFERFLPMTEFPDGEYRVLLRLVKADRSGYYELDPLTTMFVENRIPRFHYASRGGDADIDYDNPDKAWRETNRPTPAGRDGE